MLSLIVARAQDGAIGRDGTIPWSVPEDLAFFQRETLGAAVIMGRRTWESLPRRPLPRRQNIVVASGEVSGAAVLVGSVAEALEMAAAAGHLRVYGIGGARIYAELLPRAERLLITEVAVQVPDADTRFPDLDLAHWHCRARLELRAAAPRCVVHEYLRIPP